MKKFGVVLGVLSVLGGLAGFVGAEEPDLLPARGIDGAGEGYVGSGACTRCHQAEHSAWRHSSHANTIEPVSEDNLPIEVIDGDTAVHAPGKSTFRRDGERFFVVTEGDAGEDETFALTHVIGRMRVRMYVATLDDGRMQVLPGMLEEPTADWFDYSHLLFSGDAEGLDKPPLVGPGDGSFWTGSVRAWDGKCARCHTSGRRQAVPAPDEIGTRATQRALGVDCEMCHGPGAEHVSHHDAMRTGTDPIMRFAALARDRQVSICLRCHMESDVVDADFQVGDDIFEHVTPTLILAPDRIDPYGRVIELIYDGVPFSASRCAQEGGLTCVHCHEAHGSARRSQLNREAEDDRRCTGCHETIARDLKAHSGHDPQGAGGSCIACHMPFVEIERGHGVVADHSISIPRLDLPGDRVAQDACTWCHTGGLSAPDGVPRLGPTALREGYATWWPDARPPAAWKRALAAGRLEEPDAHIALAAVARDPTEYRVVRASATRLLGRYADKAPLVLLVLASDEDSLVRRSAMTALAEMRGAAVDAMLMKGLGDPAAGVRSAAARAAVAGFARVTENRALLDAVLPALRADAETAPAMEDRWFRLGAARQIAGDLEGAIEAYERYVALDPSATAVLGQIETLKRARSK